METRIVATAVMWLGTSGAAALYGRFLPLDTLTTAMTGALVALVAVYAWVVVSTR